MEQMRKIKNKRGAKRIVLWVIIGILCVALAGIITLIVYIDALLNRIVIDPNVQSTASGGQVQTEPLSDVVNVLLIGTDAEEDGGTRSDSMMIVTLDTINEKIKLTSVMRDSYVDVPGYGYNRINAAYSFGGPDLLMQTIEESFDVDLHSYVQIDFDMFKTLIDEVGGVSLTLTAEEALQVSFAPEVTQKGLTEGEHVLDGTSALVYSRIRKYVGDDYGRTERQRKVVSALINKMKSQNVVKLLSMLETVSRNVNTGFTKSQLTTLIMQSGTYFQYPIRQFRIPYPDTFEELTLPGGGEVLDVDCAENSRLLKEFLEGSGDELDLAS